MDTQASPVSLDLVGFLVYLVIVVFLAGQVILVILAGPDGRDGQE